MSSIQPPPSSASEPILAAAVRPRAHRFSHAGTAFMLVLAAALLAGAAAWVLAALIGTASWTEPLAAAAGAAVAASLLGGLALRLARAPGPSDGPPGSAASAAASRELFLCLAEREWARARRYGTGAALLLVDVDRSARLVESRGPAAADALIGELMRQTAPALRGADVVTRYATAQLAVFLAPADATGALDVAERLRERAEQLELPFSPQRQRVTVSVGVAHLRPAHLSLQALIDDAEDAVLAARQAGGNCVRAAPVEAGRQSLPGSWRDDRRPQPK
jgi:diguanylate cyclase (GGDEF)-like protein